MPGCYRVEMTAFSDCFPGLPFDIQIQINVALGNFWQPVFTPDFFFHSSFFLDGEHGWLVGNDTIFRTTDGGQSWQHIAVPLPALPDYQSLGTVHFIDEMHGIALGYDWYPQFDPNISTTLWTDDGGMTWQYSTPPQDKNFSSVAMTSPTTAFASGQYLDMFKTTDGGDTWQELSGDFPHQIGDIQHIGGDTVYYVGYKWPGPYYAPLIFGKSTDGINFSSIEINSTQFPVISPYERTTDMCFLDAQNGWFSTSGGLIFHTADGGDSWGIQLNAEVGLSNVRFINANHGLAVGSSKSVFETWDGGENWEYTYCSPNSIYGYNNLNWPVENFPTIIGDFNLLTLTDTPIFDDCFPTEVSQLQTKTILAIVQPNPVNDEAIINFTLPAPTKIEVGVYDLFGRKLRTIMPFQELPNGEFSEKFSTNGLPNGMYLIHFQSEFGMFNSKFVKQ